MDKDEIMHLVNETAPRYEPFGCEAHFQAFAQRIMEIEQKACWASLKKAREMHDVREATGKPNLLVQPDV